MKLIDGSEYQIPMTPIVNAHFVEPYNYTDAITEQLNNGIYKDFISRDDKVFIDLGSNVGLFALHVMPYAEKIICVEPVPEHMIINKILVPHGIHEQAAANDYTGQVEFFWCGINRTMSSLMDRGDRKMIVRCITLADLCEKYNLKKVDFLKCDIEGSEWAAITVQTLTPVFDIINKIHIELHPPDSNSQDKMKATLEAVGYIVEKINSDALFAHK